MAETKIIAAGKYSDLKHQGSSPADGAQSRPTLPTGAPRLFVPTLTGARNRVRLADWYWREIKEGGFLFEYLAHEKRKAPGTIRRLARFMDGFQQNNKSDFRRLAAIPARLYHRWKAEDEHFFEDDDNLRSLKRDNPDLPVYVGAKRVRGTRTKYGAKTGPNA